MINRFSSHALKYLNERSRVFAAFVKVKMLYFTGCVTIDDLEAFSSFLIALCTVYGAALTARQKLSYEGIADRPFKTAKSVAVAMGFAKLG